MLFPVCFEVCRRKISSLKLLFLASFKNAKSQRLSGNFSFAERKERSKKMGVLSAHPQWI